MAKSKYETTAKRIIKEAIKSAVFIDDEAKEPYSSNNPLEATRTEDLYKSFRKDGISLSVYQYKTTENFYKDKKFIFSNRDLVLIDWKLNGGSSGEESLRIISEIVNNQKHIHFCVIYTNETVDTVFENILSYFSETTSKELHNIGEELSDLEDDINEILDILGTIFINRFNKQIVRENTKKLYNYNPEDIIRDKIERQVSAVIEDKSDHKLCSLIRCYLAFNNKNLILSEKKQPAPSSIDLSTNTLCISNTIITIVDKNVVNPSKLFDKFLKTILNYNKGIMQLIGLEMLNKIRAKEAFISENVLQVTRDALGYHKGTHQKDFDSFIKSVMLEQLSTNLRNEKLSLLNAIDSTPYQESLKNEYIAMNVFYNSVTLNNNRPLSFGDVFLNKKTQKYYICITALCDCDQPKDHRFYFAEGVSSKDIRFALTIGDEGFISFLNNKTYIRWYEGDDDNKPIYIKPIPFYVPDNLIKRGKIKVEKITQKSNQSIVTTITLEYITTIKQNYAQRIANQAFTHPIRVGIDFVKFESEDKENDKKANRR